MATLCFRAAFFRFIIHDSGVGVVGEKVVFIPLSGWRFSTQLDHSDREDPEENPQFLPFEVLPPWNPVIALDLVISPRATSSRMRGGRSQSGAEEFTKT